MGTKRNVVVSGVDDVKIVKSDAEPTVTENETAVEATETVETPVKAAKKVSARSKKYHASRAQVDKTKNYDPFAAIELIKRLSYSKFDGTVEAHAVVKDIGDSVKVTFPFSTGRSIRVAIASDELLAEIEAGTISFDVLVATPQFMPKLTKFARILGPKGLMPNPKSGTLTPNPEQKKKELEAGSVLLKTEKKAPLIHTTLGKVSMDTKQLVENLDALIKALKGKAIKLSIAATMSPSVKVKVE